jgi:hypothetical protein
MFEREDREPAGSGVPGVEEKHESRKAGSCELPRLFSEMAVEAGGAGEGSGEEAVAEPEERLVPATNIEAEQSAQREGRPQGRPFCVLRT